MKGLIFNLENRLYGKIAVFDGDSISQGLPLKGQLPWAELIGNKNGMNWKNYSVGGGTVTAEVYVKTTGEARHWISRNIDRIHGEFERLDYLILEGGTNDADLLNDMPGSFGELDISDYSGNYDDSTFTGALEKLFFKAIKYYPTAKIGYIVAQKMGRPSEGYGAEYKRRKFFLRAIEVCKKWGIPYLDLWENCHLNPSLPSHYNPELSIDENEAQGYCYIDGQHLTSAGYAVITPRIEAFMQSL